MLSIAFPSWRLLILFTLYLLSQSVNSAAIVRPAAPTRSLWRGVEARETADASAVSPSAILRDQVQTLFSSSTTFRTTFAPPSPIGGTSTSPGVVQTLPVRDTAVGARHKNVRGMNVGNKNLGGSSNEVDGSTNAKGTNGSNGTNGTNGSNGTNGTNGSNGSDNGNTSASLPVPPSTTTASESSQSTNFAVSSPGTSSLKPFSFPEPDPGTSKRCFALPDINRTFFLFPKLNPNSSGTIAVPLGVVGVMLITVGLVILRLRQLTSARDSEGQTNQAPEAKELPTPFNLESPDAGSESVVHRALRSPYMNRVNGRQGLTPSNTVSTRQLYISNQVNRVREKVAELEAETSTLLRQSPHTSHHEGIPSSTGDVPPNLNSSGNDERLERAIQQIESLTDRIRELERERRSSWALGISDEAPPGYIE
ncbi:hypothetical protein B0H16DRAFT_1885632 [Mycena metata]|uniref:Uncharacterized protein n=1 Tax=Mycena metata TaxID=1033252 RepID=A0AAD7J5L9_9AGAR|nr:hypothetical protein B0H16DRAFT_1885632 [Mycena metata]